MSLELHVSYLQQHESLVISVCWCLFTHQEFFICPLNLQWYNELKAQYVMQYAACTGYVFAQIEASESLHSRLCDSRADGKEARLQPEATHKHDLRCHQGGTAHHVKC
jgi:hypothetical protein